MWYLKWKMKKTTKVIGKNYNTNYLNLNSFGGILIKKHFINNLLLINKNLNNKLIIFKF